MPTKAKQSKKPERLYWDSCVFLSYVEREARRLPDIEALLGRANNGDVEIVTSVATITEVAYAATERQQRALDLAVEQEIDKLWTPPSPIRLVEFHQLIAMEARSLVRFAMERTLQLKPYDAIHLSTAKYMRADRLETYDDKLQTFTGWAGCSGW